MMTFEAASLKASTKIIDEFVTSITKGGSVQIQLLDLTVAKSLQAVLDVLEISYDKERLEAQESKLRLNVYHLLDGVEIDVKDDAVESAWIHYDTKIDGAFISFKVKELNNSIGNLTISGSPTMRFRLI
jgi:hypothetical protein